MFLISFEDFDFDFEFYKGFNPLNQVYVFNFVPSSRTTLFSTSRFNPLNQVYVFNRHYKNNLRRFNYEF